MQVKINSRVFVGLASEQLPSYSEQDLEKMFQWYEEKNLVPEMEFIADDWEWYYNEEKIQEVSECRYSKDRVIHGDKVMFYVGSFE